MNHRDLYTIANDTVDNGPNTLVTQIHGFTELGLAAGDQIFVEDQMLFIMNKIAITIEHAVEWQCILPVFPNIQNLLIRNLNAAKACIEIRKGIEVCS